MNDIIEAMEARAGFHRRKNRTANIQRIISCVLVLGLILQVAGSIIVPASTFSMVNAIAATAGLMLIWFYGATEKRTPAHMARGLAGDLLIGMAREVTRNPRFTPNAATHSVFGQGGIMRTTIGLAPAQQGILAVATRVANQRQGRGNGLRIREGRIPRISSVPAEYIFTAEDVKDIADSMIHDPERLSVYETILDLIEASRRG